MPGGRYKGARIKDVPASYLLSLSEKGKCQKGILMYIEARKNSLERDVKLKY